MPTANHARPVGLLEITTTIGLIAGAVWLAAHNTRTAIRRLGRRAEETAVLTEVRALGERIDAAMEDCRASGYAEGLERRPPTPPKPRHLHLTDRYAASDT